ncbi:MAG: DUF697 domain-containing protein [Marinicaulis sp.]|nr:DUF697 domain-containing protein [Marinicaulis sp.]
MDAKTPDSQTTTPPPDPAPVVTSDADHASTERWELAYQWRVLWRGLKWTAGGLIAFAALLVVGQIYLFHQLFTDIHPMLGWGFVALVTALFAWLVAWPLFKFFHMPTIAHPPDVDLSSPSVNAADLKERVEFDRAYLKTIIDNPALSARRDAAVSAAAALDAMVAAGGSFAPALADFERERIAPLLTDLDKQIDDYIHKEALAVGSATAVSMNGSIDAFIVLWRNINMISRISRLYYGRPSMRLSLMILRDVMVAVLLSRALDDVTDAAGDAIGRVVSRLGGVVIGPLMDGSVNALMTLKLGYLAKRRCRSFDVWSKASARQAAADVFEQVKRESTNLTGELVKMTSGVLSSAGRAAGAVAGKVAAAPKSAWGLVQDAFVRKPPAKE